MYVEVNMHVVKAHQYRAFSSIVSREVTWSLGASIWITLADYSLMNSVPPTHSAGQWSPQKAQFCYGFEYSLNILMMTCIIPLHSHRLSYIP